MALKLRVVERVGRSPELAACWRLGVGRKSPPLRFDLLRASGAISGPMFEPKQRLLDRLLGWLMRPPHFEMTGVKTKELETNE